MANLQLSDHEADILRKLLENDLGDLRMEIANTDSAPFRDKLKERESIIKRLIGALGGSSD